MEGWASGIEGDEDATMMVPPCDWNSQAFADPTESWGETTQVDQPWDAEPREAHLAIGLALPPSFEEEFEDEVTALALIIEVEVPTPPALHERMPPPAPHERMPTPPMLPHSALPAALPVREKLGTTPPPQWQSPIGTDITWQEQEEHVETQEAPTRAHLQLPEPIPRTRPSLAVSPRSSRKTLVALACAVLAIGILSAVLLANQEQESAEPEGKSQGVREAIERIGGSSKNQGN